MKKHSFLHRMPENAIFWLMLLFLAFGSAASLYGRLTGRMQSADSGRVLSPVYSIQNGTTEEQPSAAPESAPDSAPVPTNHVLASPALFESAGISLPDLVSPALPAPCELRPLNTTPGR